jgi:O-antigen/teichoic acid export membrane protein
MPLGPQSGRGRLVPIFLGQALGLACGVAGVRLTSSLVPPDTLGRYSVFLTFTPIGMWVLYSGLTKFTTRHWAAAENQRDLFATTVRAGLRKLPWLILAAVIGAFATPSDARWTLFPFLLAAAALLSLGTLAQTALQAARAHWRDTLVIGISAATRSFGPPLLFSILGAEWALYAGFTAHALLFALISLGALWGTLHLGRTSRATMTLPDVYDGPLFIGLAAAGWILLSLPRWITAAFFGAEQTGYFSLASNIATLVPTVLATIFMLYFQPGFFAAPLGSSGARHMLAKQVDQAALLHAGLAVVGLLGLRFMLPWLVGPLIHVRYAPAIDFVLPAGCFALSIATAQFYHALLLAGKRESACAPVELTGAGLLIGASLVAAAVGEKVFLGWLLVSPVVPWLINRPLARRFFFQTPPP